MNKIKIVFFIPQLVGGGAEKVNFNIMKLLDKNQFEVHLIITSLKGSVYSKLPEGVVLHNLDISKTLYAIPKLRQKIIFINPDIIFSSLIRGHIAITLAIALLGKKPYVILRSPNSPKLLMKYNQIGIVSKYFLELAYKKANLIVAQTPEMKEELSDYHNINKNKINVILNPIDSENIDKNILNAINPFDTESTNVVAAGRIIYQKGFDILIKSFYEVVKKDSSYKLYIIGENVNNEQEKLEYLVKRLGLTKQIYFLGYQKNPYKYFYYSDLYVLSSRWEGLPNTVLENLYLKKPIVSTKCIPFMNQLIDNGNTGYLVDVEDIMGLAKSILNFKQLKLNFTDQIDQRNTINNFFNIRIKDEYN